MTEKKKAASGGISTGDGGGQIKLDGFEELPEKDFITNFSPAQGTIAAYLPRERASAITTWEIARITGRKPREITRQICAERRAGAPILSDPGAGFWLAANSDELQRCVVGLHRRAGEIHKTARSLEKILRGEVS